MMSVEFETGRRAAEYSVPRGIRVENPFDHQVQAAALANDARNFGLLRKMQIDWLNGFAFERDAIRAH